MKFQIAQNLRLVRTKTLFLVFITCGLLAAVDVRADSPSDPLVAGGKIYMANCATCHMVDGSGVPTMQPALDGSAVVLGDPSTLIRVVLQGPRKALPPNREPYSNTMPPFPYLSDDQIAQVLTYLRQHFAKKASPITADDVKTVRSSIH